MINNNVGVFVENVIRGYYEYKDIWYAAIDGLEISCEGEQAMCMNHHAAVSRTFTLAKVVTVDAIC